MLIPIIILIPFALLFFFFIIVYFNDKEGFYELIYDIKYWIVARKIEKKDYKNGNYTIESLGSIHYGGRERVKIKFKTLGHEKVYKIHDNGKLKDSEIFCIYAKAYNKYRKDMEREKIEKLRKECDKKIKIAKEKLELDKINLELNNNNNNNNNENKNN